MHEFRLLFGLVNAVDQTVTEDEWQGFLADIITARLWAGLTMLDARGQWREFSGNL